MVGDLPLTGGGHAAQLEKMRLCECRGRSVWNGTYGCAPISHVTTPLVRSTLLLVRLPLKETDPSLEVPPVRSAFVGSSARSLGRPNACIRSVEING